MSGTLATNTLNTIFINSFQKYLLHAEAIGGTLYEQSVIVSNVFQTTVELIQTFGKYRKPVNPIAEQYVTDSLLQEIDKVKEFESKASDHIFQITLISKSIKIFEWVREQDIEKFVNKLNKYVLFYQQKAQGEIDSLNRAHYELIKNWNETYQEFAIFIITFFKNGIEWSGNSSMPLNYVLGDTQIVHQTQIHQTLVNDISQGLQSMLNHHHQQITPIPEEPPVLQVFTKKDQKWLIQNHKDNHKDLIINTARKEDYVLIQKCEHCTVVVENNISFINIESCTKVTVLFRHTMKIEVCDSQDCNLHCFDKIQSLEMVSCENCGIYLSDKSLDARIITTKCAGIMVKFPFEDGLYQGFQICDQLVTKIVPNKGIETTIYKS